MIGTCRRSFFGALVAALVSLLNGGRVPAANYGQHRSHSCPRCGNTVYTVYAMRQGGGHWHRCGSTFWWH